MCSGNSSAVENKHSVDGKACWRTEQSCCFQSCCQDGAASCGSLFTRTPQAVCHPPQAALSQSHFLIQGGYVSSVMGTCRRLGHGKRKGNCSVHLRRAPVLVLNAMMERTRAAPDTSAALRGLVLPTFCQQLLPYSCGHVFISHYHSVF